MIIKQTLAFKNAIKKLHPNQKKILKGKINDILMNPEKGEMKKGDLVGVRVCKFQMINQLTLLSYVVSELKVTGKKRN